MQKLTCLTCHVSLPAADSQRDHYKSDWHIYNLKRKLTHLKSITEEEYERVKELHTNTSTPVESSGSSTFYCDLCRKTFLNQKAFEQHNASKKHQQHVAAKKTVGVAQNKAILKKTQSEAIKKIDLPVTTAPIVVNEEFNESDWEELDSDEEDETLEGIPIEECLFCSQHGENMVANLSHMSQAHSFFIPDLEYCVDIDGLLKYLGIKIASGRCCLWCSDYGKQFASKKAAQQHMIDKGHTKMKFENSGESLLEFEDFYDYSTSYPEGEDGEVEPSDIIELDDGDYQLKLPSGTVIGHRSLFVYYKQNLRPSTNVERKGKNKELLNNVMSQYKSLGWTGLSSKVAVQRAKDLHHLQRIQQKYHLQLGKKGNLIKQTHFRCQMGFK